MWSLFCEGLPAWAVHLPPFGGLGFPELSFAISPFWTFLPQPARLPSPYPADSFISRIGVMFDPFQLQALFAHGNRPNFSFCEENFAGFLFHPIESLAVLFLLATDSERPLMRFFPILETRVGRGNPPDSRRKFFQRWVIHRALFPPPRVSPSFLFGSGQLFRLGNQSPLLKNRKPVFWSVKKPLFTRSGPLVNPPSRLTGFFRLI